MNIRVASVLLALALALALALVAGACTQVGSDNAPSPDVTMVPPESTTTLQSTTTLGTDSWLLVAEPQDDDPTTPNVYMGALIESTIVIDPEARCVWFGSPSGIVVIFPPGTVLRPGPSPEVVMPGGTVLRDGDNVVAGGGGIRPEIIETASFLQHLVVPKACSDASDTPDGALWLLSPGVEVVESS